MDVWFMWLFRDGKFCTWGRFNCSVTAAATNRPRHIIATSLLYATLAPSRQHLPEAHGLRTCSPKKARRVYHQYTTTIEKRFVCTQSETQAPVYALNHKTNQNNRHTICINMCDATDSRQRRSASPCTTSCCSLQTLLNSHPSVQDCVGDESLMWCCTSQLLQLADTKWFSCGSVDATTSSVLGVYQTFKHCAYRQSSIQVSAAKPSFTTTHRHIRSLWTGLMLLSLLYIRTHRLIQGLSTSLDNVVYNTEVCVYVSAPTCTDKRFQANSDNNISWGVSAAQRLLWIDQFVVHAQHECVGVQQTDCSNQNVHLLYLE